MRVSIALAVLLVLLRPFVSPTHADPARQLVVMLATPARDSVAPAARGAPEGLRARIGALRLAVVGVLSDPLPEPSPAARPTPFANAASPFALDATRAWLLETRDSSSAESALVALARDPAVAWIERNRPRAPAVVSLGVLPGVAPGAASGSLLPDSAAGFPDDPCFVDSRQWGLENRGQGSAYGGIPGADVAARAAWKITTGSRDVLLAIADTGIDPGHPDLAGPLAGGAPRIEHALDLVTGTRDARDGYGHGTAVVGVMAARTGEGAHFDSMGVAGVCGGDGRANPGCRIVPIKITSDTAGVTTSWLIAQAVLYASRLSARAINLSFSGSGSSRLERLALLEAITHGCVPVVSSGNHGFRAGDLPQYPAAYAAEGLCIQVGASDPWDRRAVFSSYGPGLDLVAPGTDVWTTFLTYPTARGYSHAPYIAGSGTSFAAPFVTGAVGLLAAARPELQDSDFQNVLRESARDVGAPGVDRETGFGRLDLAAALAAVGPGSGIWHDEVAADSETAGALDTLTLGEPGLGALDRAGLWPDVRAIEVSATVVVPDSFADSIRVWPRVSGTTTVRGDFRLPYVVPWATVTLGPGRAFTLHGFAYHVTGPDSGESWLPLPRDQMRFGFTVLGRVRPTPAPGSKRPAAAPRALLVRVTPNPFRLGTHVAAAGPCAIEILDVSGRRVRSARLDGSFAQYDWDGRDASGWRMPAGLYLVRVTGPLGTATAKVLKLE